MIIYKNRPLINREHLQKLNLNESTLDNKWKVKQLFRPHPSWGFKNPVTMTRNYHNHTLPTNLEHREEETQNNNSHQKSGRQSKATSSLFPIKMIANLGHKVLNNKTTAKHRNPTNNGSNNTQ